MHKKKLTFGLNIDIAAVGWCVLEERQSADASPAGVIMDLGVRAFDAAENPKNGDALNLERRNARTMRRRLRRRTERLKKLRRVLHQHGVTPSSDEQYFAGLNRIKDPWTLRAEGLDRRLEASEWAGVLYHLVKHRGFYSARKTEESDDTKSDGGKLTAGAKRTQALFEQKGYRTPGEMAACDDDFAGAKRNKSGDYKNSFYRKLLRQELEILFKCQRDLGSAYASEKLQEQVDYLFWYQRPILSGAAILKMMVRCTFEKEEYRLAKNTWTAERFIWLTKLNNLRISDNGVHRSLTGAERALLLDQPYKKNEIKYRHIRKLLGFDSNITFLGLGYSRQKEEGKAEEETLFSARAFHLLRKVYEKAGLSELWQRRAADTDFLDKTGEALTIYKTDEELRDKLPQAGCTEEETEALLQVSFSQFINLSGKALHAIIPHMEQGSCYNEACGMAGYQQSEFLSAGECRLLPPLNSADVRNPVVFRALNQARKIINALIHKHGTPYAIHIETGRDLSCSFEERKQTERKQKQFAEKKQKQLAQLKELFPHVTEIKGKDLLKYQMYLEQGGKSAFSSEPIEPERLLDDGYTEIEHILPYSRSFDDTRNNKVLVLTKENRDRQDRTPYEYLDGANNSEQWQVFSACVKENKNFSQAKRERLLRKDFSKVQKEFSERHLKDTRYITRFFANYIKSHLKFADPENKQPVLTPNWGFTAFLRIRWGLLENRQQSDLHHALDACVIAAATHSLINRIRDYQWRRECLEILPDGTVADKKTGEISYQEYGRFPRPWNGFSEEVIARLAPDARIQVKSLSHYNEEDIARVRPVLVSRMPKRRNGGALHQEKIRSAKYMDNFRSTLRIPLENLKISHLTSVKQDGKPNNETLVGINDVRNAELVRVLRKKLEAAGGDGKKAFADPVYKPLADGSPGPLIRTVKVFSVQKGGVNVRGGIAGQASMWRVDVFEKAGKYYLVPVYQSDRKKGGKLPDRAVTSGKTRDQWVLIDETFHFQFSLCLNDLIKIRKKSKECFGYFGGLDVSIGGMNIWSHDHNISEGTEGVYRSVGVKADVLEFSKYHTDVLGQIFAAGKEERKGLSGAP